MKTIYAILIASMIGCTTATAPDEFHTFLTYGEGDSDGRSTHEYDNRTYAGRSTGDSDFWSATVGLTWYLPQPEDFRKVNRLIGHTHGDQDDNH